jgi:hypothetical protein
MTSAATDLATIGSNLSAAHTAAATQTIAVTPAAADEVSMGIAQLFSRHAANYQAVATRAAAFTDQFVQHLKTGAGSYAGAEAAAAASLQPLTAPAATTPPVLNLLSGLLADPQLIPVFLFALGFIGLAAIYIVVMQELVNFGLLPVP